MAVLHLQFDIDSEVHPELHDTLSAIGSSQSQAERLRQLAATGLVWERLRLQAYGRLQVPELGPEPAPAVTGGATLPDPAAPRQAQALPRPDASTAQSADLADFVDLSDAVDLAHLDYPEQRGAADDRPFEQHAANHDELSEETVDRAVRIPPALLLPGDHTPELPLHEIRSAVQQLPVLTEVVAAAELPHIDATTATAKQAAPAVLHAERGGSVSTGAQIHELAPARKTATRSRLMRMKDKGLFKNE